MHSDVHEIVKRDHVSGPHPDATKADWLAHATFLRRTMNINVTVVRGAVLLFLPAQPDDARDNRVPPGCVRIDNLTGRDTALDHRTRREVIAEFSRNKQRAQRRAISPDSIADPKFGSGNGIAANNLAPIQERELLIGNAHEDFGGR